MAINEPYMPLDIVYSYQDLIKSLLVNAERCPRCNMVTLWPALYFPAWNFWAQGSDSAFIRICELCNMNEQLDRLPHQVSDAIREKCLKNVVDKRRSIIQVIFKPQKKTFETKQKPSNQRSET